VAKERGARYICERGSAHIAVQDRLLREEHEAWDMPFSGIDPRVIAKEEGEYAAADCITVPSSFSLRSFLAEGIPQTRLRLLPYGVDLMRFAPTATPVPGCFDVLFVGSLSLQKGIPY